MPVAGSLLLFDIDGTLLSGASREHALALREALHTVHGLDPEFAAAVSPAGRTDGEIARLLLLAAGIPAAQIDARAPDVCAATVAAYERLCPEDLSDKVLPGIPALLAALAGRADVRLALVTGNFEPVARRKLGRAGIGEPFPGGQGGFGSDAEVRARLPEIARRRAGRLVDHGEPWPRHQTIVIGDTPRDIACARADGVRCVAVTTGRFAADELRAADVVAAAGADGLADALAPLLD